MLFNSSTNNNGKVGATIMIVAMLLSIFSFIAPTLFRVRIEGIAFQDNYYYSFVRILSWHVTLIMIFFFGFALFLRGGEDENNL